jgi:hypothetical protein
MDTAGNHEYNCPCKRIEGVLIPNIQCPNCAAKDAEIATLKTENLEWQHQIADHCIEIADLNSVIDQMKDVLRLLHTRIDDPAWSISSHLGLIEQVLKGD